jgi:hypothetical protein
MKFLPLLLANLKRKKIRTTLTIGSFVVAFFPLRPARRDSDTASGRASTWPGATAWW